MNRNQRRNWKKITWPRLIGQRHGFSLVSLQFKSKTISNDQKEDSVTIPKQMLEENYADFFLNDVLLYKNSGIEYLGRIICLGAFTEDNSFHISNALSSAGEGNYIILETIQYSPRPVQPKENTVKIFELHKFINTEINNDYKKDILMENYKKILITLNPIIPHFASEALKNINCLDKLSWPTYDQDLLKEETKPFVIQINGKKRGLIEIKLGQSEKDILNLIYQDNNLSKYLNEKEIKKKIFVPNKLMNIII